ncbi:unnamed protein product [Parnassius apollo]|uniref:(apollo) hypothetical protein n=1 Tax=Parnassius apollo TaxID=110799 RepID=A0A8S3Y652_PARAO|nr:unnamed protein product [Parnassius apollo]
MKMCYGPYKRGRCAKGCRKDGDVLRAVTKMEMCYGLQKDGDVLRAVKRWRCGTGCKKMEMCYGLQKDGDVLRAVEKIKMWYGP